MKSNGWLRVVMTVALMLGIAASASAITLQFVNAPYGQTGPYNFNITGDLPVGGDPSLPALPSPSTIPMICDDIAGGVPTGGATWEVQKHALTDASLAAGVGTPPAASAKFYGDHNVVDFLEADEIDYRAGAWLSEQLFNAVNNAAEEDRWHRALWGLFNLTAYQGGQYDTDRAAAYTAVAGGWDGWRSYAVYTRIPVDRLGTGGVQEFYARVPEASSLASLGLYIGGLGLLGYGFRRRMK